MCLKDLNAKLVSDFHIECLANDNWPDNNLENFEIDNYWFWIQENHKYNCSLWDEEDLARRVDVSDSEIAENKRNIDGFNQKRNDAIEKIDEAILKNLVDIKVAESAWLNSETCGSIIDRLSIISLKILHMGIQSERVDISEKLIAEAKEKKERLIVQKADLMLSLDRIFKGLVEGQIYYRVYRQFKMYNDANMNPYLSGLR